MKYEELIKQFMIESTSYKKDDEIDYNITTLKSLLNNGYGIKIIATGGGMADEKQFGDDAQKADFVKKAKEKNKIDIIVNNAKDALKYAIEPKLKYKGRKLVIVITEEPVIKEAKMDHNEYPKRLRKKTEDELRYIIKDAQEAMDANPDSEKSRNGYYADEINYASMELKRREKGGKIEEAEKSIEDKEKFIMDHGMTIGGSKTTNGGKVYHIKYLDTGSTTGGFTSKEEAINNAYRIALKKSNVNEGILGSIGNAVKNVANKITGNDNNKKIELNNPKDYAIKYVADLKRNYGLLQGAIQNFDYMIKQLPQDITNNQKMGADPKQLELFKQIIPKYDKEFKQLGTNIMNDIQTIVKQLSITDEELKKME